MTSSILCSKCNKTFSSMGNLNVHLKTVCNEKVEKIECEYCHKEFKIQLTLTRHYITCKTKLQQEVDNDINIKTQYEKLKIEFNLLTEKFQVLESNHRTDIKNLNDKLEFKYKTELNFAKEKIHLYEDQIQRIEDEKKSLSDLLTTLTDKFSIGGIQTNSNNTVNIQVENRNVNMAIFDQLKPITDETFFQYGQELTQTVLLQGLESVISLGMKHLKDKVVCTDKSRNTLKYKMKDQIINDKGGVRLAEQLIEQSIEPKVKIYDNILVDVYKKKSRDHTVLKEEQAQLDSMIELRNAIISNDENLKTKIGSKLSKRAATNHAIIADLNGATTQNMWEFFNNSNKSCERILFNSIEYFLVRDANKNVIRALEVDEDGIPIMNTDIDFSEQARAQAQKLLPPPLHSRSDQNDTLQVPVQESEASFLGCTDYPHLHDKHSGGIKSPNKNASQPVKIRQKRGRPKKVSCPNLEQVPLLNI